MSAAEFDERAFRARVNSALEKVRTILDLSRTPKPAGEVQHRYDDKFLVAENLVNSASAATLVALEALGVKPASVAQMREWARTRSVTIRLRADEKCTFLRKVEREVQSDTSSVFSNSILGVFKSFTTTKVTEFFWRFDPHYELVAFQGNDTDNAIVLLSRSGSIELKTSAESTPRPASVVLPNIDANITWLLLNTDNRGAGTLKVDRSDRQCRTPRRNAQVEAALNAARAFMPFVASTVSYLGDSWIKVDRDCTQPSKLEAMFVPVLPLLEVENGHAVTLSADPFGPFLAEQRRSLATLIEDLTKVTVNPKLVTVEELKLEAILFHVTMVLAALQEGLDYLEHLLYHQIVTAIGKEVTSADFADYQRFHNRKLFKQQYQMRQFAYAIRRPGHAPEGTVTIDHQIRGDTLADPVYTSVSHAVAARPMKFAINAATHVHFRGDRFLHGLVLHKFSGDSESSMSLVARARQFSSFVVLLGAIAGADTFEPKYAFIVRNKDEMRIPLNSEALPTAKEFRDAIESTSPEQQRFAKAYRSMQMEATLFGICVIQIKPQMERLLHLGDDALTKETALTQRLMEMFITHQISPDMFSYDGPSEADGAARIARVQHLVSHIEDMVIGKQIKKEQQQASQAQQLAAAQVDVPIASAVSTEILYALVAHNHTVLVEAASVHGNIPRVARLALTRLPSPRAPRLSYAYDNKYHLHFATSAPITVMCVTAADTSKRLCYGFLEDVRSSFVAKYDLATRSSAIELQMQSTFGRTLTERMEFWSRNSEDAKIAMVRREMEEVKAIMAGIQQLVSEQSTQLDSIESIDRMLDRGSRLELLVDKTETLQEQSYKFKAQAVTLKKRTWGGGLLSSAISAIADATSTKEYAPLPPSPSPSPASVVATAATTEPPKPVQALQPEASSAPAVATDAPAANLAPAEKPPSKAVEKVVAPPAINEARTDYTQVPRDMERRLEEADAESAARPTTLTAGAKWERLRHKTLLSPAEKETLEKAEHEKERIKAFDLLDALTRSGELTIDCAELHVIVATTYCFDKSLMSTLVVDNVNPIERLERTAAVVASVVHNAPPAELVSSEARDRMVATGAAHLLD